MNAYDELVARLCRRREQQLGGLSDGGRAELVRAVRDDPTAFIDTPADEAFALVVRALDRHDSAAEGKDLLDDEAFYEARSARLARLARDCQAALDLDPGCLDAALLIVLAQDVEPERLLGRLIELEKEVGEPQSQDGADLWEDLAARPRLRVSAAIARTLLDSARYRMAAARCEKLVSCAPNDQLGARHTGLLAYARLEDEDAFDALDVRFSRQGSAWRHIAHAILLYKLGRMGAARRALDGYARLCEGGAYALLRPVMADIYLPDRPPVKPLSFEEATLAVHEADPIIMDVPDFVGWIEGQEAITHLAEGFARRHDLDW